MMLAGPVPEDELCLLLARGQLLPDVRARALELLAAPLRWDSFCSGPESIKSSPCFIAVSG